MEKPKTQLPPLDFHRIAPIDRIRLLRFDFTGPYPFPPTAMPPFEGIYAILASDMVGILRDRVLYIGETMNMSERLCDSHERCDDWKREAKGRQLCFAYLSTPGATDEQRKRVQEALIKEYAPPCNTRSCPSKNDESPSRKSEITAKYAP